MLHGFAAWSTRWAAAWLEWHPGFLDHPLSKLLDLGERFASGKAYKKIGAQLLDGNFRIERNNQSAARKLRPGVDSIVEGDAETCNCRVQGQFGSVEYQRP